MKANEFVKKYGWDHSKDVANGWITNYEDINLNDLKNLVNAYELVEKRGGLSEAKVIEQQYWNSGVGSAMIVSMELKQAIELVESCT